MISSRVLQLQEALAGFAKTGLDLIGFDGTKFKPTGFGDDIGIYYFIPKMVRFFHWSLELAIDRFYFLILAISLIVAILGSLLILRHYLSRVYAIIILMHLAYFSWLINDVYLVQVAIVIALVPWAIYFLNRKKDFFFYLFLFLSGTMIEISNYVRNNSGTAVLIFILILILLKNWQFNKKIILTKILSILVILLGLIIPIIFFHQKISQRDQFLLTQEPNYQSVTLRHPFWHPAYLGLAYLNNRYVAAWDDTVACQKVISISPTAGYLSREYENILKQEVIKIFKNDPFFVLQTILAKIRAIMYFILWWGNFGLIAALVWRKPRELEIAFWLAIVFSSLYGIVALPLSVYLLGMIAFSSIYNLCSFGYALERGIIPRLKIKTKE